MEEIIIVGLKYVLLLVMVGAIIVIFTEIVPMARGKTLSRVEQKQDKEE